MSTKKMTPKMIAKALGADRVVHLEPTRTPTPWRVGDAGMTVFGPPNGNPSPKVVASITNNKANAAFIVKSVNAHADYEKALKSFISTFQHDIENDAPMDGADTVECVQNFYAMFKEVLAKAEGRS